MKSSLGHEAPRPWMFDGTVTECFEDMIQRSIPQYEVMRKACSDLAKKYVRQGTDIVDLGCSLGGAIDELVTEYGAHNRFLCVEASPPMREAFQKKYLGLLKCRVVELLALDLRRDFPACKASVILAVLTLQFVPIEYRQRIVRQVYENLLPGGAFLFVEKVLGADALTDPPLAALYYQLKKDNGYPDDAIERKRLSLEGVLVPVTAKWNEDFLRLAGFQHVDCFWRWMNFAGWLAVK